MPRGDNVLRTVLITLALLLSVACARVPALNEAEAMGVIQSAGELMSNSGKEGNVPADRWPAAIQRLHPESVRIDQDGVYIQTDSVFVQEWGLFIPREPGTFAPVAGSDPSYEQVHASLFSYHIAG
jgi:hypothetical protein